MSPLLGLGIAWAIPTAILIILLIYKSTLSMHEDDQIFLNDSESHMEKEQVEILAKMNRIMPIVKVLGALSGVLLLTWGGLFIYEGLTRSTSIQ